MNWPIMVCAAVFWFEQNEYFGWNGKPKSDAELIGDGITILLIALAFISRGTTVTVNA